MASTNKTEKLNLNQWVETDPVLREDFNADNAILDEVISNMPWVRILDVVTTEEAAQLDLDISDIDVSQFTDYYFVCTIVGPLSASGSSIGCMRVNGLSSSQYHGSSGTMDYLTSCTSQHQVKLRHIPNQRVWAFTQIASLSSSSTSCRSNCYCTATELSRINSINVCLQSGANIPAGTRLILYGLG
ncbi:MAG: hypothetical protein Q4A39_05080 [Eubacteriales bacterium]|nr:hypothetical protein [Eubacteriales bacterium]